MSAITHDAGVWFCPRCRAPGWLVENHLTGAWYGVACKCPRVTAGPPAGPEGEQPHTERRAPP